MRIVTPVRQMLNRVQRRFVRSRPGSVLILVVALLVLMALIGTAYMSMAQDDRATSAQHSFNTEVDLLLDGVVNLTKGVVTGDLFVNGQFRPGGIAGNPEYNTPVGAAGGASYSYWNGLGLDLQTASMLGPNTNPGNPWLAARLPELQTPNAMANAANPPMWRFISAPLTGNSQYDTPYWPAGPKTPVNFNRSLPPGTALAGLVPGQTKFMVDGQFRPALLNTYLAAVPNPDPVLAADTDEDGITDAGLFKLLTLDGITYYGAVRIVDNCAAINASIATRPNPTVAGTPSTGEIPGDFSPVNLDLEGMLVNLNITQPPTDLYRPGAAPNRGLLTYRYNGRMPTASPLDENGTVRSDFSYAQYAYAGTSLVFDQQWMQLGRRLQNPGAIAIVNGKPVDFQALPIGESMAMARNFILRDPGVINPNASPSILEQTLQNTVYETAPYAPYQPYDTMNWFNQNFNYFFDYLTKQNTMPMRALLVSQNPVSNFVPTKFTDRGNYVAFPYSFGDMVTFQKNRYVCIKPFPSGQPIPPSVDPYYTDPNWAFEPWTTAPTKTSINTASFQQLYAAYWEVMCEQANVPPFNNPPVGTINNNNRMFRSPIRIPPGVPPAGTPPPLLALHTLYLRAALAAVNTMGLRDSTALSPVTTPAIPPTSGNDVISRTITIPGTPYQANVYSVRRQPYITEVYARNDMDPANDWMALELYNPYPQAISLTNWHLATLARGMNPKILTDVGIIPPATGQTTAVIQPNSFLVITNNATIPPYLTGGIDPMVSKSFVVMQKLVPQAFGSEVVVLRPRLTNAAAPLMPSTVANNVYNEAMLDDLIPIDSYDLSNLPATAAPAPQEWHYIRPNDPAQKAWHFVYPGRWGMPGAGGVGGAPPPTVEPTLARISPEGVTPLPTLGHFNVQPVAGIPPYLDVPIQVDNVDFGGPLKVMGATGNYFPFGGFARNGDMLQTTFIGSYKIYPIGQPHSIIELNPITMDSAMATARDATDGANQYEPIVVPGGNSENIGRFCPIDMRDAAGTGVDDFANAVAGWRYHWAARLFDYLTVQSPQDDYLPNVDPWLKDPGYGPPFSYRYLPANTSPSLIPQPVANVTRGVANAGLLTGLPPNGTTEETAPVNGLVNINTAPWRTLAAVPWVPASASPTTYQSDNAVIAQAIVKYRDVDAGTGKPHGPFKSIFELNDVPVPGGPFFRDKFGNNVLFKMPKYGDLSPLVGASDGVIGDFEPTFQALTRVSNLITTRSDSYTAYILIQGWRNAETANPHLVVQRRAAILIDRSSITPLLKTPGITNIPTN